jgi:hypothetical protein
VSAQKFEDIKNMANGLIPDDVIKLSELPLPELVQKYLNLLPKLELMEPKIIKMHRQ